MVDCVVIEVTEKEDSTTTGDTTTGTDDNYTGDYGGTPQPDQDTATETEGTKIFGLKKEYVAGGALALGVLAIIGGDVRRTRHRDRDQTEQEAYGGYYGYDDRSDIEGRTDAYTEYDDRDR